MADSFQRLSGSALRASNRLRCSSKLTENQYFSTTVPDRTSIRSSSGQLRRNSSCSASVQNPITHSTFERLYQLRSKSTISPAAGSWATYRWKYHWVRSRSVGLGSATTRTVRGLVRSVIRWIAPPLPAEPRPSKITRTLRPWDWIQYCSSTSCSWSRAISASYGADLSFPRELYRSSFRSSRGRTSSAAVGGVRCLLMAPPSVACILRPSGRGGKVLALIAHVSEPQCALADVGHDRGHGAA